MSLHTTVVQRSKEDEKHMKQKCWSMDIPRRSGSESEFNKANVIFILEQSTCGTSCSTFSGGMIAALTIANSQGNIDRA